MGRVRCDPRTHARDEAVLTRVSAEVALGGHSKLIP